MLVAALCLVFFFAEVNETSTISLETSTSRPPTAAVASVTPAAAAVAAAGDIDEGDGARNERASARRDENESPEIVPPGSSLVGGLRRFESFEEYVVSSERSE